MTISEHMAVEELTLAEEVKLSNSPVHNKLTAYFHDVPIRYIGHKDLKRSANDAKAVIRTGEASPYANAIVHSGVIFK